MFHAAHALLSQQGLEARTHRGTLALLREHFKESLGQDALGDLATAQDLREASDYDVMFRIDPDEVADLLERAASFVHRVEALIG